jgi:hypothetical protein
LENKVRRILQIAIVSFIPLTLGGLLWPQTNSVDTGANVGLTSIERKAVQSDDEPPNFDMSERFSISFPEIPAKSGHVLNRTVHNDISQWPDMKYLNDPVVLDGSEITISDYRIVAGGSTPIAYLPETGEKYDAPDGGLRWAGWGSPAVVIPPGSSLVIVRVDLSPPVRWENDCINPLTGEKTQLEDRYLSLAYPELGEVTPLRTFVPGRVDYGPYNQPQQDCFGNGWYYFFLATLSPNPSRIWLTYNDYSDPEIQAAWTLTSRP